MYKFIPYKFSHLRQVLLGLFQVGFQESLKEGLCMKSSS